MGIPLPTGAMGLYLLLLVGHMTVAVLATTPVADVTNSSVAHIAHLDATTDRHVTSSFKHTAIPTAIPTVAVLATTPVADVTNSFVAHIAHLDATTDRYVTTSFKHSAIHTVHQTSERKVHHTTHDTRVVGPTDVLVTPHPTISVHQTSERKVHHTTHDTRVVGPTDSLETTHPTISDHDLKRNEDSRSITKHSSLTKEAVPSAPGKIQISQVTGSLSTPIVNILGKDNSFHISCISKRGPQPIHYVLMQGDQILKNLTVHGHEPAMFTINTIPGSSHLYCKARASNGEEAMSAPLRILGDTPESNDRILEITKSEKEEGDASSSFLISLTFILTSVSQQVQNTNSVIISVCGPVLLIVIIIVLLTHSCKRRGARLRSSLLSSTV